MVLRLFIPISIIISIMYIYNMRVVDHLFTMHEHMNSGLMVVELTKLKKIVSFIFFFVYLISQCLCND